jgi:uncharacterized C2H2 Zn-finger protein
MPSEGSKQRTKYAPEQSEGTEWMLRAACRGTPMVDGHSIFFPKIVKSPGIPREGSHDEAPNAVYYQEAIALCSRCDVIYDCEKEYTREPIPRDGMYFGKTPTQRVRLQSKIRKSD